MLTSSRRVLVVEDEPQVAGMLNDVFTTHGYTVEVAGTGPDALRVVPGFGPDDVLLDLALPGMPGEMVLDCLHAADADPPIIVMTGKGDRDLPSTVRARGAYDFVAKPFNLPRLMLIVKRRSRSGTDRRGTDAFWGRLSARGWTPLPTRHELPTS